MLVVFVLLCLQATGLHALSASTTTPTVAVKENNGADMKCEYSADFGASPRVEWKFRSQQGSQSFIYFDNKITDKYKGLVTQYPGGLRIEKATRQNTGDYSCEVSSDAGYAEATIKLTVLVPPSVPVAQIPTSATTGRSVLLTCSDKNASPPPTYKWYKNGTPLPQDPSKFPEFKNLTYKMDPQSGNLVFPSVSKADSGSYFCEVSNSQGTQRGAPVAMDVRDLNVGGIVAGVIVALLAVALLLFGLWYATKKGYMPKMTERKPKATVYTKPAQDYGDEDDGEFKQKQSFVV